MIELNIMILFKTIKTCLLNIEIKHKKALINKTFIKAKIFFANSNRIYLMYLPILTAKTKT